MKLRWRASAPSGSTLETLSIGPSSEPISRELQTRGAARLLLSFLWIQAAGFLVYLVASAWVDPGAWMRYGTQTAFGWTVLAILAWAVRRGRVVLAAVGYLACGWLLLSASAYTAGGVTGSAPLGYLVLIVAAGLLLGTRATVATAAVCGVTVLALAVAGREGALPPTAIRNP
ncbi:MAG TPA: hypothetical protein VFE93_16030, partial [Myxococcaceae bacterium]|nr:hypothetical protein [Myxococcaceae bacterium]